jgi:hypothetical protein
MDEVGRGTGIEDGLSIAYGVLKYLIEKNQCRTLFSTHLPHVGSLLLRKDMSTNVSNSYNDNLDGFQAKEYLKIAKLGFFCFGSSKNVSTRPSVTVSFMVSNEYYNEKEC